MERVRELNGQTYFDLSNVPVKDILNLFIKDGVHTPIHDGGYYKLEERENEE